MLQTIIVAEGIQFRDIQGKELVDFLNKVADKGKSSLNVWTYPKQMSGRPAAFEVRVVYEKQAFDAALNTSGAYVVYEGHSAYGQGPTFGPKEAPYIPIERSNPWADHFCMGYDAVFVPAIAYLLRHSILAKEYDLNTTPPWAFLPEALKEVADSLKKRTATTREELYVWQPFAPELDEAQTARNEQPLRGRHYFLFQPGLEYESDDEYLCSVRAGAEDLEKSSLKCALLFMSCCGSKPYFHEVLKRRRAIAKSKCKFYLTLHNTAASNGMNFVKQVFAGYDPLDPRGAYAVLSALNGEDGSGMIAMYSPERDELFKDGVGGFPYGYREVQSD